MLGCHDFCGYYEWTFHYLRRRFGTAALEKYWAEAIATESQAHYIAAAKSKGLRGLYEAWSKTGVDEHCDWTVALDEARNLVRLDMRQCPSKGFLLENCLNADEDYCDHCMGWIGPALNRAGFEVAAHEHNHCGQCWWEVRRSDAPQPLVQLETDIRRDGRWGQGYLHRFEHHRRLPLVTGAATADACDVLVDWFGSAGLLVVLGPEIRQSDLEAASGADAALVTSGEVYAAGVVPTKLVRGVILSHDPVVLSAVAKRFGACESRPLLMHAYLPGEAILNFSEHGLPRAVPLLPLLIRSGVYEHEPALRPSAYELAILLAAALDKRVEVRGVDKTEIVHHKIGRKSQ